jgi:hypothetical protein
VSINAALFVFAGVIAYQIILSKPIVKTYHVGKNACLMESAGRFYRRESY